MSLPAHPGLRQKIKQLAGIVVVLVTIFFFAYYVHQHPHILDGLGQAGTIIVITILALYGVILYTNAYILHWSISLCGKLISYFETLLLTSYSSLVNFFGPLQSGPGFRAIYLKKKHDVSLKAYGTATLLYYGTFGLINVLLVMTGLPVEFAVVGILGLCVGLYIGYRFLSKRLGIIKHSKEIAHIVAMTLIQVIFMILVFYIELHTVNETITLQQTLIYTGAANLALFVSLTPGALGIRESFLYFSQDLHHIVTQDIVAASIIDRGVYFIFLGLLFVITSVFHLQERFKHSADSGKP